MRELCCLLAVAVLIAVVVAQRPTVTPKFKLGKDTTYISEPLDAEGFVDYETALNEKLRGKIKPEENVVALLVEAIGPKPEGKELHADFFKWLGTKPLPAKGEYYIPLAEAFKDEMAGDNFSAFDARQTLRVSEPWTAKDDPAFAEWLATNEKPLAKVAEAVKRKEFFLPHIGRDGDKKTGLFGSLGVNLPLYLREIALGLVLRSMLRCGEGKFVHGWQDVLIVHRLARFIGRRELMIDLVVGVAVEQVAIRQTLAILATGRLTAEQTARIRDDLLSLPDPILVVTALDGGERYFELDTLRVFRQEGLARLTYQQGPKPSAEKLQATVGQLDFETLLRSANATTDRLVKAIRFPTRAAQQQELNAILAALPKVKDGEFDPLDPLEDIRKLLEETDANKLRTAVTNEIAGRFGSRTVAAVKPLVDMEARTDQNRRNLLVAVALAGHVADTGKYPAKLADLAPKYLAKVPDDLFSGKALVYKPAKDGYLFYSVGVNGTDDGGKLLTDPVVNPADGRGDDLGVRVPRPKRFN